jgi:hypothetical protein
MFGSLRMTVLACVVAVAFAGGLRDERPRGHYGPDFQYGTHNTETTPLVSGPMIRP